MIKRKIVVLLLIVILLVVGVFGYFKLSSTEIAAPNQNTPTKQYLKSMSAKDAVIQMLKDMYPSDEVVIKKDGTNYLKECQKRWCVFSYLEDASVNILRIDGNEYDVEKNGVFVVTKYSKEDPIEDLQRHEKFYNEHIVIKYPNALGKDYWFQKVNDKFLIDSNANGYDKSINYNYQPIGYKKSLPFKEYFEKIQFKD